MGRIHRFLGLTVGVVVPDDSSPDEKRAQYHSDITYGTNNEIRFRLPPRQHGRRASASRCSGATATSRGARTTSRSSTRSTRSSSTRRVRRSSSRAARPTRPSSTTSSRASPGACSATATTRSTKRSGPSSPPKTASSASSRRSASRTSTRTSTRTTCTSCSRPCAGRSSSSATSTTSCSDGEVKIVDEFTGRILEGRRWSEGLHQAVEAKEGVKIKEENQTLATVTLQNYFRLYDKLGGMTGTANTEAGEFAHTYDLQVVSIPTNRPMVRVGQLRLHLQDRRREVRRRRSKTSSSGNEKGQPVLVGTISVEKSEQLSRELEKKGITHEVLNAKQHEREAEIVTQAGQAQGGHRRDEHGRAGRRHPARRQSRGSREARVPEGRPRARTRRSTTARYAELLPKFDEQCKAEGDKVRELGGLYVLGTERHESRRIDNQLRGRAGRQGDPGESRFYLSLEDELMRLFATGFMSRVMNASFPDDMPLESKMVSQRGRARAGNGRGPQLRDPQERAQVRRGDERAAQGHLQAPPADPRRRRPPRRSQSRRSTRRSSRLVDQYCTGEYHEEWDVPGLLDAARVVLPDARHQGADRRRSSHAQALEELFLDDADRALQREGSARSARRRCATSSGA